MPGGVGFLADLQIKLYYIPYFQAFTYNQGTKSMLYKSET